MNKVLQFNIAVSIALVVFLICYGIHFLYLDVLKPSYYSTIAECKADGNKIAEQNGYVKVGSFSVSTTTINESSGTNCTNVTTQITVLDPNNKDKILKHELCHKRQYEENRVGGCDHIVQAYLNEAECYLDEYL